tara:strand:- start:230 stop:415 length:186 start_codon:yes stop_codon:yes gene_type:complete
MDLNLTPEQLKRELEILTDKVINFQEKPKTVPTKKQKPRVSSGKYGSVKYGNNDNTIRRTT